MNLNQKRREAALTKELLTVEKQEKKMQQAVLKAKPAGGGPGPSAGLSAGVGKAAASTGVVY